jgi:hypothetical protein
MRMARQERRASPRRGCELRRCSCNCERFRPTARTSARRGSEGNELATHSGRYPASGDCRIRAAGVSGGRQPAVAVGEMHLQVRCRKVAADYHRCAYERWCSRGSETTGG